MSLNNPKSLVTEERLHEFYGSILPYLGGMPEVLANKFSKGDMYSTDEKMIGQWIDGKPLYAKTINTGALSNAPHKKVAHSISNLGEIVSMFATYHRTDGKWFQISNVHLTAANKTLQLSITTTNVEMESNSGDYSDVDKSYVTLQYTKTTDTAVSIGDDTDYSTEEKIVGTWVDGSPIYQRTVQMTLPTKNTDTTLDVSSWNINIVVSCQGTSASMQSAPMTTYVGDSNYHYHCFVNMPNKLLYVRNLGSTLGVGDTSYVTIQYTKTT